MYCSLSIGYTYCLLHKAENPSIRYICNYCNFLVSLSLNHYTVTFSVSFYRFDICLRRASAAHLVPILINVTAHLIPVLLPLCLQPWNEMTNEHHDKAVT